MADSVPIETRTYKQLPLATAVSPDALVAFQEDEGPVSAIEVKKLLGRLIQTNTAKETAAALLADLAHDANSIGLTYADPTPAKNGWWRKTGASGAGTWTQFEKLQAYASSEAAAQVAQAVTAKNDAQAASAAATATAAGIKNRYIVLSQTNADGRLIEATREAGVTFPADGTGTVFKLTVGGPKTLGSAQVTLAGFGVLALNEKGGGAIAEGRWQTGDTIEFWRPTAASQFELVRVNRIAGTDLTYATDAEAFAGTAPKPVQPANLQTYTRGRLLVASDLQLPTAARPGRLFVPEAGRLIVSIRLRDGDYRDGFTRTPSDMLHIELRDIKPHWTAHAASALPVWAINAIYADLGGQRCWFSNFMWDKLLGAVSETGIGPSTFEFAQFAGKGATSNAAIYGGPGSGIYHGLISTAQLNIVATGAVLNGATVANGTDVKALLTPGSVMFFTQLDFQTIVQLFDPDGVSVVGTAINLARIGGGDQLLWKPSITWSADAKVTHGYIAMWPLNGLDRIQGNAVGNTAVQNITAAGGVNFGAATKVVGWNSNQPGRVCEFEINGAFAPFRVGGVAVPWSTDAALFTLNDAEKAKLYLSTFQDSLSSTVVNGQTFDTHVYYRAVRANGI